MSDTDRPSLLRQVLAAAGRAVKAGLAQVWHVVRVALPLSLAMALLEWSGALPKASLVLAPIAGVFGLPGEAVLAVLVSAVFNLYGAVAVMLTLSLNLWQATILSIICLVAHSLAVETAQMKKAGSSATKMIVLRLFLGLALGFGCTFLLPRSLGAYSFSVALVPEAQALLPVLGSWLVLALRLVLLMGFVAFAVAIVARVLDEFHILDLLAKILGPFVKFLGLKAEWARPLLVINVFGYAAAGAAITAQIQDGKIKPQEGDLFNHHAAVSHALLEDTTILVFLGLSIFWLVVPRLALAVLVVWIERIRRHYFRRSFRAGVA